MTKSQDIIIEMETLFGNELRAEWDKTDGLVRGDTNKIVKKAAISLELRENLVERNDDMLILHHPPIFGADRGTTNPFFDRIKSKNIVIYALHSRIDKPGFVNESIAKGLFDMKDYEMKKILDDGTVIIELNESLDIEDILSVIKNKFHLKYLNIILKKNTIKRIAIHGGEGFNQHHVIDALRENVDLYLAGDMTHHLAEHASFFNASFIDIGHFSEQEGMKRLSEHLKERFKDVEFNYIEQSPWWISR